MDINLLNGGGGDNDNDNDNESAVIVVSSFPDRADPEAEEKQTFTWLHAAPYVAVMLAGVALFVAGAVLMATRSCSGVVGDAAGCVDGLGYLLSVLGQVLMGFTGAVASVVLKQDYEFCARRLDEDGD